ncbi:hypothetical protein [Portibacter lacus]|uniref:Uncharacterized protein n=1 Tax=Portibacter lacus TaxID=1099794 RepID=A0AA37SMC2_9BACT|nr:hypothetical protein [Portibacter lacus]GLR17348.1 hypothetical protein GCM10007940_19630 [Portibacter lacus]
MDIFEQWKIIEKEKFNHSPINKEDIMEAIYQKSTGTMEILKTRLKYKMMWVLFFTGCFTGLALWQFDNLPVVLIFGAAALLYGLAYFGLRTYYLKMGSEKKELSTLDVMKNNYKLINGALKFEGNIMYPTVPLMLLGAIAVPGLIEGETLLSIYGEPKTLTIAIVSIIILVPLVKFFGDKMNKIAYGSFINKLEDNIKEMEMVG